VGALLGERYQRANFERFAALLALNASVIDAPEHLGVQISTDPDDDKFLACALVARIHLIVSGDSHLLNVSGWNDIRVMKPRTFVDRYLKNE
jgi:predicted nucleic acid-binding protein